MKKLATILLGLLLFPGISFANITRDSSITSQVIANGTSLSWTHTVSGTGTLLVVSCQGNFNNGTNNLTTATDNGAAMTEIGTGAAGAADGYGRFGYMYYLIGAATGANTVIVNSSPSGFINCESQSYDGVKSSGNPVQTNAGAYVNTNGTLTFSGLTTATGRWSMFSIQTRDSGNCSSFTPTGATLAAGGNGNSGVYDSNGDTGSSVSFAYAGCTQSYTVGLYGTFDAATTTPAVTATLLGLVRSWWIF